METHSGDGRKVDVEVPQPGAAADRLGELWYNKLLQINPAQGIAAAATPSGGVAEDGSELPPLTLAPGESAARLNPSVGRHDEYARDRYQQQFTDPGVAALDPRHVTGYGLSYGQYDSGEASGGRGGGGEEGEAGEAAAAARLGCLGGPDVTSGPGAAAVEDEAATGARALQRQAELADLSREAAGAAAGNYAGGGSGGGAPTGFATPNGSRLWQCSGSPAPADSSNAAAVYEAADVDVSTKCAGPGGAHEVGGGGASGGASGGGSSGGDNAAHEAARHAAAAAAANTPLTAAELGAGVTGEQPLRPEDFCELGNEAGGAVEAVQAAAASTAAGRDPVGDPGGALRPGEGAVREDVVLVGGGGGGSSQRRHAGPQLSAGDYEF